LQLKVRLFCSSRRVEDGQRRRRVNNGALYHFLLYKNELIRHYWRDQYGCLWLGRILFLD